MYLPVSFIFLKPFTTTVAASVRLLAHPQFFPLLKRNHGICRWWYHVQCFGTVKWHAESTLRVLPNATPIRSFPFPTNFFDRPLLPCKAMGKGKRHSKLPGSGPGTPSTGSFHILFGFQGQFNLPIGASRSGATEGLSVTQAVVARLLRTQKNPTLTC